MGHKTDQHRYMPPTTEASTEVTFAKAHHATFALNGERKPSLTVAKLLEAMGFGDALQEGARFGITVKLLSLFSVFCLLPAALCLAQPEPIELPASVCAAICRVSVDEAGATSHGSGTLIDRFDRAKGYVVTNWHVVTDRRSPAVTLAWHTAERTAGRVLGEDRQWDLAIIEADVPPGMTEAVLRADAARIGEPVKVAGYAGGQMVLRGSAGTFAGWAGNAGSRSYYFMECERAVSVPGMSGGPILDAQHRLAGVLFGGRRGETCGASSLKVCELMQQCVGGWCPPWQRPETPGRGGRTTQTAPPGYTPPPTTANPPPPTPPIDTSQFATKSDLAALEQRVGAKLTDLQKQLARQTATPSRISQLESDAQDAAAKISQLNDKLQTLAATPLGQAVETAAGDAVSAATGIGPILKLVATNVGLPAAGALAAAALLIHIARPKLPANLTQNLTAIESKLSALAGGPGGSAAPDPFSTVARGPKPTDQTGHA
ncbi:MAG TPA: trypsin-like peptidase domain-containing protein [Pirellulales bacterium]|nr:trypsin-like peptidase domain-containing protein [Pirellulales bacterium]